MYVEKRLTIKELRELPVGTVLEIQNIAYTLWVKATVTAHGVTTEPFPGYPSGTSYSFCCGQSHPWSTPIRIHGKQEEVTDKIIAELKASELERMKDDRYALHVYGRLLK